MTKPINPKKVIQISEPGSRHVVGDGFHVRNFFPSNDLGEKVDPFLLLDYAGPTNYSATDHARGVGEHPHRGFETVTIVYQGRVQHRDSAGNAGTIGPGDVQWMTAASGVVHEEKHEAGFAKEGGILEMVQLWVNLPKAQKMSAPKYQAITSDAIPVLELPDGAGQARIIAGELAGLKGAAQTFTPVELFDLRLKAGKESDWELPEGHNLAILALHGEVLINDSELLEEGQIAILSAEGSSFKLNATEDATLLILGGEPIKEPIVSHGPFVMNSMAEIKQAFSDYQAGRMGRLSA